MNTKDNVEELLLCRIASGEWRSEDKLPSLKELSATYAASPGTVVKALDVLKKMELVTSKRGGSFQVVQGGRNIARQELRNRFAALGVRILEMAESANVAVAINYTERA